MIRTRLSIWNAMVFASVLTLMGLVVFYTTRSNLYGGVDEDLSFRTKVMERSWKEFADSGLLEPNPSIEVSSVDPIETKRVKFMMQLVSPRIVIRSGLRWVSVDEPFDRRMYNLSMLGRREFGTILLDGHCVRVHSVPLQDGGKVVGVAQFATDLQPVDSAVESLGRVCLVLLPLGLVITALVGVFVTGQALKPVREIADAASRIEATNLADRLPVHGKDEFAMLSTTFNKMLATLQESFEKLSNTYEAQKQFIADASHELKTPLTAIKGRVGIALRKEQAPERYQEHLKAIGRSTDAMTAIVRDLLTIARVEEASLTLNPGEFMLYDAVEEAIYQLPPQRKSHVTIHNCVPHGLELEGDRSLIVRALINLLDNAVRHSDEGGVVNVNASQEDATVEIVVEDFGSGIDAKHLPRIFDRFYRTDTSRDRERGGTGLGLSIVKSIADVHRGAASISSTLNRGTRVTLRLPSQFIKSGATLPDHEDS